MAICTISSRPNDEMHQAIPDRSINCPISRSSGSRRRADRGTVGLLQGAAHAHNNRFNYVIKPTISISAGQTRSVAPIRRISAPRKRSDDTRTRIIDETVRCIQDEGFSAATAKHVAEHAGVTWGVIQYHFCDRNVLLMAVVDDGVNRLIDSLSAAT